MRDAATLARLALTFYPIGTFCHDSRNLQSEHGAALGLIQDLHAVLKLILFSRTYGY